MTPKFLQTKVDTNGGNHFVVLNINIEQLSISLSSKLIQFINMEKSSIIFSLKIKGDGGTHEDNSHNG